MPMEDTPLIIAYNYQINLYSSSLFSSYTQFNDFITTTPLVSLLTPPTLIDDQLQQSRIRTALFNRRTPPPLTDNQPQQSSSRTACVQPPHNAAANRRPAAAIQQSNSNCQPPHTAATNIRSAASIQQLYIKSTKWSTHSSPTMRH